MNLPRPKYFTIEQLAKEWDTDYKSILSMGESGYIPLLWVDDGGNYIPVLPSDIASLSQNKLLCEGEFIRLLKENYPSAHFLEYMGAGGITITINIDKIRISVSDVEAHESKEVINTGSKTLDSIMEAVRLFPKEHSDYSKQSINKSIVEKWVHDSGFESDTRKAKVYSDIIYETYNLSRDIK